MKKFEKQIGNYKIQFDFAEETDNSVTFRITLPPKRRKHRMASIAYSDLVEAIKNEYSSSVKEASKASKTTLLLQPLKNSIINIQFTKNAPPKFELQEEVSFSTSETNKKKSYKSKTKKKSYKSKTKKKIETEVEVVE